MIREAYVSYEIAKLLKEKGFDWDCNAIYGRRGEFQRNTDRAFNNGGLHVTSAPTHQMACAWLREKGIFFCVHPDYPVSKNYIVEFYDDGVPSGLFGAYEKYDDAVEAALKYTLENLL